eukprot:scaffold60075_cov31-Tisochrysis_lutea.AAC.2
MFGRCHRPLVHKPRQLGRIVNTADGTAHRIAVLHARGREAPLVAPADECWRGDCGSPPLCMHVYCCWQRQARMHEEGRDCLKEGGKEGGPGL